MDDIERMEAKLHCKISHTNEYLHTGLFICLRFQNEVSVLMV